MKINSLRRRQIPFMILIFFTLTMLTFSISTGASESSIETILKPSESKTYYLEITTGSEPVSKLDVVFLFDVTGSMDWVLDTCKDRAEEIKYSIKEMVDDTAFAVAWFADYPGYYTYSDYSSNYGETTDSPWTLLQDLTSDQYLVDEAIQNLPYKSGGDVPESCTRALYETEFLNWRDGSKRVVVVFGDAPLHDLDFYDSDRILDLYDTRSFGGDPGRDSIAMTEDDLNFETVVSELKDAFIVVMGVFCTPNIEPEYIEVARECFDYMTAETGGKLIDIENAAEIPQAIESLIESEIAKIKTLTLSVPTEYTDFVTWTPQAFEDVGPEETVTFELTIAVPSDIEHADEVNFSIDASGDGVIVSRTDVSLTIPTLESAETSQVAQLVLTTALAAIGGFGATFLENLIGKSDGGEITLEAGDVIEDVEIVEKISVSRFRQMMTLVLGTSFVAAMYTLTTASITSKLFEIRLPYELPFIGDSVSLEYIFDFYYDIFIEIFPVILLCTAAVFIWRYVLELSTSKKIGIQTAIAGNIIGAVTLLGTTFLTMPLGFPMTSKYEQRINDKNKGHLAFIKNFGLLTLMAPFYLIARYWLLGNLSLAVEYVGNLIVLMTFVYNLIPFNDEGKDLFRWNKALSLILIILGLSIFFGFQLEKIPVIIYPTVGIIALIASLIGLSVLKRGEKDAEQEQQEEIVAEPTVEPDSQMRYCPYCGADITPATKFCSKCGMEI